MWYRCSGGRRGSFSARTNWSSVAASRMLRGGVVDLAHERANTARGRVGALRARPCVCVPHAFDGRERAIESPQNTARADLLGMAREEVSAPLSLLALQHPALLELEQNELEKLLRDSLFGGEVGDEHGPAAVFAREAHHRLQPVFRFLRYHINL